MFRNLMNGISLSAMMLRDGNNDEGADDPKAKLRAELAKGNTPPPEEENEADEEDDDSEEDEEDEKDDEEGEVDPPAEETDEQKVEREAKEKLEAKATRKQDRMQRRIDKAVAEKRIAEEALAAFKNANPDSKLTEAEIEEKAEAKAAKKLADKELADITARFEADCSKLQKEALKADKDFSDKIEDIADDIGPIPSFMIGVLSDLDNGGEVLAHIANDDELAEEIWGLKPAKMTRKIVELSNKLADAKKPLKKQISKVPDPGTPVKANRVVSNTITEADAKNMDTYVAKRQRQMMEARKAKGFN